MGTAKREKKVKVLIDPFILFASLLTLSLLLSSPPLKVNLADLFGAGGMGGFPGGAFGGMGGMGGGRE